MMMGELGRREVKMCALGSSVPEPLAMTRMCFFLEAEATTFLAPLLAADAERDFASIDCCVRRS
jgi:hypothetical protein